MGSGKTTVAKALSKLAQWSVLDTDAHIESSENCSITSLFETRGELYFRALEFELCQTLPHLSETIVATGGGFPIPKINQDILRSSGYVVYLSSHFDTLQDRVGTGIDRPLFRDGAKARDLYASRTPVYSALSHLSVETDTMTATEIAQVIWDNYCNQRTD
ncbi:hypothetical protein HOH87_03670 [bacterium]|jgi:shikimate kinase|nr:hypothetical protein [bacterium]